MKLLIERNNFDLKLTPVDKGAGQPGFYYVTGNAVGGNINYTLPSSSNINYCYVVNLVKGKTYRYTGYNYSNTFGLVIGTAVGEPSLLLSPSMGTLSEDTYTGVNINVYGTDVLFTVSENNLKAFITVFTDDAISGRTMPSLLKDYGTLYEVSDVTPYDRTIVRDIWNTVQPMYTYERSYLQQTVHEGETNNRNPYSIKSIDNDNL